MQKGDRILYDSGEFVEKESGMTIKIRGNTSAAAAGKKPYKIKLQKKADLLRRGDDFYAEKDWVLLKTGYTLNNMIGFWLGRLMGMEWTPGFEYVNLVINGDYQGIYTLTESVEQGINRVNIPGDTGFLFEYDAYFWNEEFYIPSSFPFPVGYTFKYPDAENLSTWEVQYMTNVISQMERSVSQADYPQYIDVESFAKWALAQDILGVRDYYGTNMFLMKDGINIDEKIRMGILWDFDTIMELQNMWAGVHYAGSCFIRQLFINPWCTDFVSAYRRCWNNVVDDRVIESLIDSLSVYSRSIHAAGADKSRRWEEERWRKQYTTVAEDVAAATEWFTERFDFLNDTIAALYSMYDTPTLMENIEMRESHTLSIYDLQGRKLHQKPERGIYICDGKKYVIIK